MARNKGRRAKTFANTPRDDDSRITQTPSPATSGGSKRGKNMPPQTMAEYLEQRKKNKADLSYPMVRFDVATEKWHAEVGSTPQEYAKAELVKYQTLPVGAQVANLPEYPEWHVDGLAANERARFYEKMRAFPFNDTTAPELNGSACTTAPFILHGDGVFKHPMSEDMAAKEPENIVTKMLTNTPLGMNLLKHLSFRDISALSGVSTRYHRILSSGYIQLFDLSDLSEGAFNYLDLSDDEWEEKKPTLPVDMQETRRRGWAYIYVTMSRPMTQSGFADVLWNTQRCLKALWNFAPKVKNLILTRMVYANPELLDAILRCPRFENLERFVVAGNRLMPIGMENKLFKAVQERTMAGMNPIQLEFSPANWRGPKDQNRFGDYVVSFSDPGVHIPRAVMCQVLFDTLPVAFELGYDWHTPSSLYRQMLERIPLPPMALARALNAFLRSRDRYVKKNKSRRGKGSISGAGLREHLLDDKTFLTRVYNALHEWDELPSDDDLRRHTCCITNKTYPTFIGQNIQGLSDDSGIMKLRLHNNKANEHQQKYLNCIVLYGLMTSDKMEQVFGFERFINVQKQWDGKMFASGGQQDDSPLDVDEFGNEIPREVIPNVPHFYTPKLNNIDAWRAREEADFLTRTNNAMMAAQWLDQTRLRNIHGKRSKISPGCGLPKRIHLHPGDWFGPLQLRHGNDPTEIKIKLAQQYGPASCHTPQLKLGEQHYQRTDNWDTNRARWLPIQYQGNWRFEDKHKWDLETWKERIEMLEKASGAKADHTFDHVSIRRQEPDHNQQMHLDNGWPTDYTTPIAPTVPFLSGEKQPEIQVESDNPPQAEASEKTDEPKVSPVRILKITDIPPHKRGKAKVEAQEPKNDQAHLLPHQRRNNNKGKGPAAAATTTPATNVTATNTQRSDKMVFKSAASWAAIAKLPEQTNAGTGVDPPPSPSPAPRQGRPAALASKTTNQAPSRGPQQPKTWAKVAGTQNGAAQPAAPVQPAVEEFKQTPNKWLYGYW